MQTKDSKNLDEWDELKRQANLIESKLDQKLILYKSHTPTTEIEELITKVIKILSLH